MANIGNVLAKLADSVGMTPAEQNVLRNIDKVITDHDRMYRIMSAWGLSIKPNFSRGISGAGTVPVGAIAIFDTACPSGWTRVTAFDGKFLRGASSYGGTGGASTHTHTGVNAHSHGAGSLGTSTDGSHSHSYHSNSTNYTLGGGAGATGTVGTSNSTGSGGSHSHSVGGSTASEGSGLSSSSSLPPYIDVVFCKFNG